MNLWLANAALLILIMATINCFIAIKFPIYYATRWTTKKTITTIIFALVVALLESLLTFLLKDGRHFWKDVGCLYRFVLDFELYAYIYVLAGQIIPLIIIFGIYIYLFYAVRKAVNQRQRQKMYSSPAGDAAQTPSGKVVKHSSSASPQKKHIDAAKRFALIVIAYVICLMPLEVLNVLQVWPGWYCGMICKSATSLLKTLKPLTDSLLYTYHNSELRMAMINMLRCRIIDSSRESPNANKIQTNRPKHIADRANPAFEEEQDIGP